MRLCLALIALALLLAVDASKSSNKTATARTGSEPTSQVKVLNNAQNKTTTTSKPQTQRVMPLDSKNGRLLARMQTKRQAGEATGGGLTSSRRNEDPWFLDQTPYPLQPYRFVYNVKGKNGQTEQYRQEVGDGKFLSGSYGYMLPDGIYRHVDYVADDRGFRAFIRTSEPGTANQNPANVVINSTPPLGYLQPEVAISQQQVASAALLPLPQYSGASPALPDYSTLPRRPPGSIVNTSLRNFTSFSFTTPPPPPSPSGIGNLIDWNATAARAEQDIGRVRPLSSGSRPEQSDSWQSQPQSQHQNQVTKQQQQQQQQQYQEPQLQPQFPSNNYNRFGYLGQPSDTPPQPLQPASRSRAPLEQPSRAGPNRLAYDLPLSSTGELSKPKLLYDTSHVLHPDLPYLSLERARSLEQLNHLNGLHYVRPLLTGNGELSAGVGGLPSSSAPQQQHHSSQVGHSRSEEHHLRHQESHSSQLDESGRSSSRDQGGGSRSGVVRESEYRQSGAGQLQQLPPPPPYQSQRGANSELAGSNAGTKGGRLQAPYLAGFGTQHQTEVSAGNDLPSSPAFGLPTPPSTPAPPRAPEEPTRPEPPSAADQQQQRTTPSEPADAGEPPEERQQPAVKGGVKGGDLRRSQPEPSSWSPAANGGGSGEQLRPTRNPVDEYRTNMIMNDLRAMQNTFGLPQPPRLQRSSSAAGFESQAEEQLRGQSRAAEETIAARMRRVEALLSNAQQQQSSPVSASTPTRTLVESGNEIESGPKAIASPAKRKQFISGPLAKIGRDGGSLELPTGGETLNETVAFDARRLSAANRAAARLQAEKVSELEKFQQRLRSQQLLLEQTKRPATSGSSSENRTVTRPRNPSADVVNSHVKYDDQADSATPPPDSRPADALGRVQLFKALDPSGRDFPRTRRDGTAGAAEDKPNVGLVASTESSGEANKTNVAPPLAGRNRSEFAQQARRWPSLASGNLSETSTTSPLASNPNPTPNSVSMDFINSVTSLSVSQLNPFSSGSVNPAVQRSSQLQAHSLQSAAGVGVATSNARYTSSPELLARSERANEESARSTAPSAGGSAIGSWASNHQLAPYAMPARAAAGMMTEASGSAPAGTSRDGFEVRDRAAQLDNYRFYEVVSGAGASRDDEPRAFRDAQLSVPALSS